MNHRLSQYIPFISPRRSWREKYFNETTMNYLWPALGGIGLGAGLMYILDPDRGRARRATARDKVRSAVNRTGRAVGRSSRDLSNRARGLVAETGSLFRRDETEQGPELRH